MIPDDDTIEIEARESFAKLFFAPERESFDVSVAAATHPGNVRSRNEDHYSVLRRARTCEIMLSNLDHEQMELPTDETYSMVVADGMGGAAFGDFASRLAVQTMVALTGRATSWLMKFTDLDAQEVHQRVGAYVEEMQRVFRSYCQADPSLAGMGTTWTSAHLLPPHAVVVNIGDSRAYLFRYRVLTQLTRDQTLAQEMIDDGAAADEVFRFRHILTSSLGGDGESAEPEVVHLELQSGDRLLLCSDGLSDMIDDQTIAEVLAETEPQATCDQLIDAALRAGGKDNITVVLADVQ